MIRPSAGTTSPASSSTTSPGTSSVDSTSSTLPDRGAPGRGAPGAAASASTLARALQLLARAHDDVERHQRAARRRPSRTCPIAKLATADDQQHDVHRVRQLAAGDRPDARRRLGRQLVGPVALSARAQLGASSPLSASTPSRSATASADWLCQPACWLSRSAISDLRLGRKLRARTGHPGPGTARSPPTYVKHDAKSQDYPHRNQRRRFVDQCRQREGHEHGYDGKERRREQ